MRRYCLLLLICTCLPACRDRHDRAPVAQTEVRPGLGVSYASGLTIEKEDSGITVLTVASPWPNAVKGFTYALVPRNLAPFITLNSDAYDAIITVPIERLVVTSTTHIPALEALGVLDRLVGFPETRYISSPAARTMVEKGLVTDIGSNETVNTEIVLELRPDLLVGFAVNNQNRAYDLLQDSNIPVVYNGDWTEESPLGKAEWIKFFASFFELEQRADSIFKTIEQDYLEARQLAAKSDSTPKVLSGALYKDVWYLPGGRSWAAQFLEDANANYLWKDSESVGSLSLSVESVLQQAGDADYWISPSQYVSYEGMELANRHYKQIKAFRKKEVYTFAKTTGATGGYLYYELGPNRPDLVLKDLIHILHPGLLPNHVPYFFKPLD